MNAVGMKRLIDQNGLFVVLVVAVIQLWNGTLAIPINVNTSLINGPQPMSVVAPLGSIVTFTCAVNTTELSTGTSLFGFSWIEDGEVLSPSSADQESINGSLEISTLQRTVIQEYITGVLFQCQIVVLESNSMSTVLRSNTNATLTAYGELNYKVNL